MLQLEWEDVLRYYTQDWVMKEIAEYARRRWVAVEGMGRGGKRIFIRYWSRGGPPIFLEKYEDVEKVLKSFHFLKPRTFYSTINIYGEILSREDLDLPEKILASSIVWDIDGVEGYWRECVEAAKLLVEILEEEGVQRSVYFVWSGRGIHVHVNGLAISEEVRKKYHPLNISYNIVEYIIGKIWKDFEEIASSVKPTLSRTMKIENKIDIKRVFTVPLSLHRSLDLAAVCFKPTDLKSFHISWADPSNPHHNTGWREYEVGEADALAIKAVKSLKSDILPEQIMVRHTRKAVSRPPGRARLIGRFPVMALLQAARYFLLTGDFEKAQSFGLNRAIFYAWAKRRGRRIARKVSEAKEAPSLQMRKPEMRLVHLGDEGVYQDESGWFRIGEERQLPEDYRRQVIEKFERIIPYDKVWAYALDYLKQFPRDILLSQKEFYDEVYKPVRDKFLDMILKSEEA